MSNIIVPYKLQEECFKTLVTVHEKYYRKERFIEATSRGGIEVLGLEQTNR
jgi:hypothetical protein